jgi:16S rRNA (cytidine1402-2'-O)-methyltransferase
LRSAALVLVATPIGNLGDISSRAVAELRDADVIAAEDTRRARKLLSHLGIPARGRLVAVHGHNEARMAARLVEEVRGGRRVVFVSDAGTPGVSDPGERLVAACVRAGLVVEAVPGPSAALAALVVSGLPTDRFVFEGFLPRKGSQRAQRLAALAAETRTAVLFEAPQRVAVTLAALADALGAHRPVAVARELTKVHEDVWRGRLGDAAAAVGAEPRGEYVLVVGGSPSRAAEPTDDDIVAALDEAMAGGASRRDAADSVAGSLGVPRRRAYGLAVGRGDAGEPGEAEGIKGRRPR